MQTIKKILTILGITVMVVCCGVFALSHVSGFGWKALAIPTGSMRPNILPGSLVLVHRVPDSTLKVGDVITYANPMKQSDTISHRIIKIYSIDGKIPSYITKGDANPSPDQPVVAGQVEGKVVWHAKYIGNLILYSKDPIVILPIVYLAAVLIMIEEVQQLAEYYRRFVYRLPGYRRRETEADHTVAKRVSLGGALTTAFVVIGLAISPAALAALRSNTVVLANNRLSMAQNQCKDGDNDKDDNGKCKDNDGKCDGDGDKDDKNCSKQCKSNQSNNVNVTTTTTQTATSGNTKSTGNGSATSGNASNSNSTSVNLNVSNNSKNC